MNSFALIASILLIFLLSFVVESRNKLLQNASQGTRWVVLVAGSLAYDNHRHQADMCHAYQILKKGGLKVLLGNKTGLSGGNGKVVNSGPNDYIFVYYADHGSPGIVAMLSGGGLHAKDLIQELRKKHEVKSYKRMVLYLEACESAGNMVDGLLIEEMNIYVYEICLGSLLRVSWIDEDSEKHDLQNKETLKRQHGVVLKRTLVDYMDFSSHVHNTGNCSLRDIEIGESQVPPEPNGIPKFLVEISNICATGCDIMRIHLNCAGFTSRNLINPKIFRHPKNSTICVINNDEPLKFGLMVSFYYTTSFMYKFSVASVECV